MEKSMKESGKTVSLQVKESKPGLMGENMTEYGDQENQLGLERKSIQMEDRNKDTGKKENSLKDVINFH